MEITAQDVANWLHANADKVVFSTSGEVLIIDRTVYMVQDDAILVTLKGIE